MSEKDEKLKEENKKFEENRKAELQRQLGELYARYQLKTALKKKSSLQIK